MKIGGIVWFVSVYGDCVRRSGKVETVETGRTSEKSDWSKRWKRGMFEAILLVGSFWEES